MYPEEIYKYNENSFSVTTFSELVYPKSITINQQHTNLISLESHVSKSPCDGVRFQNNTKNKIAIKTADCLPIYFRGKSESVFLHAGWRGLKDDILIQKAVKEIDPQLVLIGPSIQAKSFEVKEDFYKLMPFDEFYSRIDKKLFFNLQAFASSVIQRHHPNAKQIISKICTYENHQFHSYRRDKTALRNWHIYSSSV